MLSSEEIRERERRRRRLEPLWGLVSFLLHGLLIAALVLLTPVRTLLIDEEKPQKSAAEDLSADRIEQIGETLSDVRARELLQQIDDLQTVLHNMDLVKEELAKDFDAFAEKSADDARSLLEKILEETAAAQQRAVRAQASVTAEVAEMVRVETQDDLRRQETKQDLQAKLEHLEKETAEQTNTAQAEAVNALDRLQVKAEFVGFKRTAEAAVAFREAQVEAARLQDSVQMSAAETAREMTRVADNAKVIADHERVIAENKAKKAENEKVLAEQNESNASKKAVEKAKRHIAEAERVINVRQERVALEYTRREQLEKARAEKATERQIEALEASGKVQQDLNARLEILKATLASDQAELVRHAQREDRRENSLVEKSARQLSMAEAYELARELESAVADSYKEVKAFETAMAKRMSFEAAAKLTDVAKPERPDVDAKLLEENVRTKADLDRQKQAQTEAVREAKAMADNAKAMMEKAMELVQVPASGQAAAQRAEALRRLEEADFAERQDAEAVRERLAELAASAEYQVELAEAAAEDSSQKAKDIAELMKTPGEPPAGESAGAHPGPPELKAGDLALVPGNVMTLSGDETKGLPAKWMYVNSWYVIGPFPNPNRANLRVKFQPESKVDLDATYRGKDGRMLRWEYQQAKNCKPPQPWMADWHAEVIPEGNEEYVIFYAYAEVFFDEACDRWIAIGSDDRSDVWINDMPVWGSSNKLKAWTLAEDFRRVHFKKGRNRILARIENGHWNFGWSLCISTTDSKEMK